MQFTEPTRGRHVVYRDSGYYPAYPAAVARVYRPWAAVLKRTRHDEIHVVSYRRAREQQVKKWEA